MRKYIVTHTVMGRSISKSFANGFIIAGHYNHSYESFGKLVREALTAFPQLKDDDIECLTVLKSMWCKSCPIIRFPLQVGTEKEGWTQIEDRLPDVSW